jgi:hypothetical protein
MSTPIRVLYIAGWGRSGSTILDGVLGQIDRVASVGEIKFIWERGFIQNRRCSCGEPFSDCPFWRKVVSVALPGWDLPRIESLDEASRKARTRHLPWMLSKRSLESYGKEMTNYRSTLASLYAAILGAADADLIVDSSKFPSYAFLLRQDPRFDLRVVHLVRDPRAVAFSWTRDKIDPDAPGGERMIKLPPLATALYWSAWNVATERLCRVHEIPRLVVKYEDLVAAPRGAVARIAEFAGIGDRTLPFLDDRSVALESNHAVSGNAIRFKLGRVEISADRDWEVQMSRLHRSTAWLASWPVRRRYGYS